MYQLDTNTFTTIALPAYITPWSVDEIIGKCLAQMKQNCTVYFLDMGNAKHVYSATGRVIMRLYDRASRLGSSLVIINACEAVQSALRTLQLHALVPIMSAEEDPVVMSESPALAQ